MMECPQVDQPAARDIRPKSSHGNFSIQLSHADPPRAAGNLFWLVMLGI